MNKEEQSQIDSRIENCTPVCMAICSLISRILGHDELEVQFCKGGTSRAFDMRRARARPPWEQNLATRGPGWQAIACHLAGRLFCQAGGPESHFAFLCNCREIELCPLMVYFYLLLRMSIEILSLYNTFCGVMDAGTGASDQWNSSLSSNRGS